MAYEDDSFDVSASGDLDRILTEIGGQLEDQGADTIEVQAAFAFAAVDEIVITVKEATEAEEAFFRMTEAMHRYLLTQIGRVN